MPNEVNTQKSVNLNRQDSEQEKDLNDECNIPMN
jgi:hypothetical protein